MPEEKERSSDEELQKLLKKSADVEDFLAFGAQAVKRFEFAVGNERHQTLLCAA